MSDKETLPCPACQETGSDKSGNHLTIFPGGKFSCALNPGDKEHNRRIIELVPSLGSDPASPPLQPKRLPSNPKPCLIDWPACVAAFDENKIHELAGERGYSPAFVEWLKARELIGIYKGQWALPMHGDDGKVIGVHHKHESGSWRTVGSTGPLVIGNRDAAKWLVFESQWDAFAVMESLDYHLKDYEGPCTVLITRGAGNGAFTSLIPKEAEAIVVMQNDEPKANGTIPAERWLEKIKAVLRAKLRVARPPQDVKDCNDWLLAGNADFHRMFLEAETVVSLGLFARDANDLANDAGLVEPPILVEGLLHKGSVLLLGASSKSFKSWSLIYLAACVANGQPWWGQPCTTGRVLLVDFELTPFFWRKRANEIVHACGLTLKGIRVINCRGHSSDDALKAIEDEARAMPFDLIVIDPLYSFLAGKDENSAGDVGKVLQRLAKLSETTGAALAISHHFSKGNQAGKDSIDRFSGSGVFARFPDTLLTMTRHEEEGAFVVDPIVRNFPPMKSFVLRWQHPVMVRDGALDPAQVKKQAGAFQPKYALNQVLEVMGETAMTSREIESACRRSCGMADSTVKRLLSKGKRTGEVTQPSAGHWQRVTGSRP